MQLTQDAVSMLSASLYLVGDHERLGSRLMCKRLVVRSWQGAQCADGLGGLCEELVFSLWTICVWGWVWKIKEFLWCVRVGFAL